jgi:two-component system NarL family sensor kinase
MDEPSRRELTEQILGAEQDERRRIALFLHDGPVQSLAGIALMLDAALHFIDQGRHDEAASVLRNALERHRVTIGELRDLSFSLEPVVLRDQGLGVAVKALAEQQGMEHGIRIDVDVDAAESLGERTRAALYEIVREALEGSIRRGPPTSFSVRVRATELGIETVIEDDAPGERRRRSIEVLEERARTLGASVSFEHTEAGTTIRLVLPPYAATH